SLDRTKKIAFEIINGFSSNSISWGSILKMLPQLIEKLRIFKKNKDWLVSDKPILSSSEDWDLVNIRERN
ncbi:MAG: hypothetical protein DRG35_05380, partial [Deltaproteobacteria bacterium]